MTTFRPRSCPRCHGDIYRDNDPLDDDWYCLQCGRTLRAAVAAARPRKRRLNPAA
ncbi:MAG: hypothetical protein R3C39_12885 [Dehalococcoidia bacterium]